MSVMVQNKYGEYQPLDNERIEPDNESQLVYARGFVDAVNEAISDIANRFYFIGFRLDEANRYKYYEALGYSNIEELAEAEFGFQRASTYNYIKAFNYAKSKTPLYIEDKFRGYSYTALLEMSKARTVKRYNGNEGIENILTPKVSVSKIKQVRPLWDKYIEENGSLPNCKTVDEFIELVKEREEPAPTPLLELAAETEENPVQSIRLSEPEEQPQGEPPAVVECELIKAQDKPSADFVDGEDYSQYDDEPIMTDEQLAQYCLTAGTGFANGKFNIYDKWLKGDFTTAEFIRFVRSEYCILKIYHEGDRFYKGFSPGEKGLEISRNGGGKLILSWAIVAGKIKRLIESDRYLTVIEKSEFPKWKADREGLVVNMDDGRASTEPEPSADVLPVSDKEYDALIKNLDELIAPKDKAKVKILNLKNEKARKAWLDDFRSWGVWLEVKEVDKTFYRFDFANGAALIVEIGFEYWNSWSTQKGAHERVSYSIIDEEHPKFNSQGESYTNVITWLTAHAKEI